MALLLVFFTLELAKDESYRADENQEEDDDKQQLQQETQQYVSVEVLPVSSRQNSAEVEETTINCQEYSLPPVEELQLTETCEENIQAQSCANTATQTLREGIALVLPEEDETQEMGVRYDRSFTAKLIQSTDEVKEWYGEIKNHLLSYKKVRARTSWGRESYRVGRDCVARLIIKGKTLCVLLAIIPQSCQDTKYKIEDLADLTSCKDTPCLYRIKSKRKLNYAKELIDIIMAEYNVATIKNREDLDYYLPYEGTLNLIKKGLIKRKIVEKRADFLSNINIPSDNGDKIDVA